MALTTHQAPSPAILDVFFNGVKPVGQMVCEVDGYWYFAYGGSGGVTSADFHEQIAKLLRELNAPHEQRLSEYFASLPPEIDRTEQDDGMPF